MANPKLFNVIQPGSGLLSGDSSALVAPGQGGSFMPAGPTISRGRGCWNCLHWDPDKGKQHWNERRKGLLTLALQHKAEGREDKAKGLAMMVDKTDQAVKQGTFGLCGKGHSVPGCNDPVPLIHYQELCHMWNGKDGSSLATDGHPIDLLPEELREVYHPKPDPKIVAQAKADAEAAKAAQTHNKDR